MTRKSSDKKAMETAGEPGVDPVPAAAAAEDLEQLKTDAAKASENWDKLLRATADFENFKKRAARERQDAILYANAGLFQKLIPVLDNFEMALAATAGVPEAAAQSVQEGINMIAAQLRTALADSGLEEINAAGQLFDPNFHEAVSQRESNEVPDGHVLQQLRKGYKLRDRLLRPATVIVAKSPALRTDSPGSPDGE
ncbi:MAG: molecular chaperone GrpE [Verrucomicrobiota bacterium]